MIRSFVKRILVEILRIEAVFILKKYRPRIVGVTGSVGKTSTKDAIALALSARYTVGKSPKTYNTEVGIPLTILGCKTGWTNPLLWLKNILEGIGVLLFRGSYPEWLVIEIGIDAPGDMRQIARWLPLDIAVLTYVGTSPVHVEFFGSPEKLRAEKGLILDCLREGGVFLKNADDASLATIQSRRGHRTYTYGYSDQSDFRIADEHSETTRIDHGIEYESGISFEAIADAVNGRISLVGMGGKQLAYAAIAAYAVANIAGVPGPQAAAALTAFSNPSGRLRPISGIKQSLIIDDSYNSSPAALQLALFQLGKIKTTGRKIAVLGDMLELGRFTIVAHEEAGAQVAHVADILLAVGVRSKFILEGALRAGMKESSLAHFDRSEEAGFALQELLREGDVALVKGSQSMRMERVVAEVMKEPSRRNELLVRQDDYWRSKKN
ncbi:MAG: hypothetical protein HYS59_02625 [Candidatus Vogelbacteria bacterium]|nr:hypothetical protein [Candidatus Vogelbacteria bacterium]